MAGVREALPRNAAVTKEQIKDMENQLDKAARTTKAAATYMRSKKEQKARNGNSEAEWKESPGAWRSRTRSKMR